MKKFNMIDVEDVSLVVGVQGTRDREKGMLTISQQNYTNLILKRFGMGSCKPFDTPEFGPELMAKQPEETLLDAEVKQCYQAITGSLMYLAQPPATTSCTASDSSHGLCRPFWRSTWEREARSPYPFRDQGLQHHVQGGRTEPRGVLRLQLGQQSGQRTSHIIVHHDDAHVVAKFQVFETSMPDSHFHIEG